MEDTKEYKKWDKCMICLEECSNYIKLPYCNCKNITHEKCFNDYINEYNKNDNNNEVKCLICKNITDFDEIIKNTCSNPFFNSFLYIIFIAIQNMYFYVDKNFFPESFTIFRTVSAVVFHVFLTIALIMPYIIFIYVSYIIMIFKKPYKICNL